MILIERLSCVDNLEASKNERLFIEQLNATLNKQIPSRSIKEWQKQYYENNTEKLSEQMQQYYENNKDKVLSST